MKIWWNLCLKLCLFIVLLRQIAFGDFCENPILKLYNYIQILSNIVYNPNTHENDQVPFFHTKIFEFDR